MQPLLSKERVRVRRKKGEGDTRTDGGRWGQQPDVWYGEWRNQTTKE